MSAFLPGLFQVSVQEPLSAFLISDSCFLSLGVRFDIEQILKLILISDVKMSFPFHGFSYDSVHATVPAKPSKGKDWYRQPEDYNKGQLKSGFANFHQPVIEHREPTHESMYPGYEASDTPGEDWNRNPEQYETHRLKGMTNNQDFMLDPFIAPSVSQQISNFKEHYALQDKLHPFQTALGALPQMFAKHKEAQDTKMKGLWAIETQRRVVANLPAMSFEDFSTAHADWIKSQVGAQAPRSFADFTSPPVPLAPPLVQPPPVPVDPFAGLVALNPLPPLVSVAQPVALLRCHQHHIIQKEEQEMDKSLYNRQFIVWVNPVHFNI
jgi:hypothetical protein